MKILFLICILVLLIIYVNFYQNKQKLIETVIDLKKNIDYFSLLENLYNKHFKHRFLIYQNNDKLDNIDTVYCITMPQRKNYITNQINKLNINYKIFDAVKPSDLTSEDYSNLSTINIEGSKLFKKYTRLCVLLSFIMCFIDALKNNYKTIIIFEDDIQIDVNIKKLNKTLIEFNNSIFDVFFMGYCYLNCKKGKQIINSKELIDVTGEHIVCAHALCLKTKILKDLINYCFPMIDNSDEMFCKYFNKNKIKICIPKSVYFNQNRNSLGTLNESFDDELKTCIF